MMGLSEDTTLEVQFVGSGDAFGSGGRLQTCIHVRDDHFGFLLDCGTSSLIGMRRLRVDPNAIGAILLTHLHGDHFGGIPFFLLDAQLISRRERPLLIAGPRGLEQRIRDAQEVLFPGSSQVELPFDVRFIELREGEPTAVGPVQVAAFPVVHFSGGPSLAVRTTYGGKTIAYSGDTEWTATLVDAAKGADLFICESYFYEKKIRFHLDYATLRARVSDLGCERIMLAHMSGDMLVHADDVELEAACDGMTLEL